MGGQLCLVGDIGGTNARFAVVEAGASANDLRAPLGLKCADFPTIEDAIRQYLAQTGQAPPATAVIAIAGPVENGVVTQTNGVWRVSEASLRAFGFARARLINDYAALAAASTRLRAEDVVTIGPDVIGAPDETIAILGAGTGFGVAALVRGAGAEAAMVSEGGHVSFAPCDETEIEILRLLASRYGRVSIERLLSGPGLSDLHWAMAQVRGEDAPRLQASEIVQRAQAQADTLCVETLDRFCAIYGAVAGDFALAYGAKSGVLVAGGIAPRILDALRAGAFRRRFEDKGRFHDYVAKIPTRVIVHPYAALVGAAALAAR